MWRLERLSSKFSRKHGRRFISNSTIAFSNTVDDQQVGSIWAGQHLVSLALSGDLHYLDARTDKAVKTVHGHQKAITAFVASTKDKTLYTGSYDGRVYAWSTDSGLAKPVTGAGHTNQTSGFSVADGKIYSIGMDDMLRTIDLSSKTFG